MKSIKLLMATAMLVIGSTAAMAQASYTDKDGNEYQFKRHWFLDIQAGGQYTVGEASFSDLLSPNFQGAIGYQFSPVFGLRGQINGIWSKGGWNGEQWHEMTCKLGKGIPEAIAKTALELG